MQIARSNGIKAAKKALDLSPAGGESVEPMEIGEGVVVIEEGGETVVTERVVFHEIKEDGSEANRKVDKKKLSDGGLDSSGAFKLLKNMQDKARADETSMET